VYTDNFLASGSRRRIDGLEEERMTGLALHAPAVYEIRLQGKLDRSWATEVGMAIDNAVYADRGTVTTLVGELRDQAALFGVLNRIYGLGYPLLSVMYLPSESVDRETR
jgi:hypothetical protein